MLEVQCAYTYSSVLSRSCSDSNKETLVLHSVSSTFCRARVHVQTIYYHVKLRNCFLFLIGIISGQSTLFYTQTSVSLLQSSDIAGNSNIPRMVNWHAALYPPSCSTQNDLPQISRQRAEQTHFCMAVKTIRPSCVPLLWKVQMDL